MQKFVQSGSAELNADVTNIGIQMFKRVDEECVYINLDIFYSNLEEYNERTLFEKSNKNWNEIWFNKNNKHEEVSVEIFEKI
jgi:hypothetical protein